VVVSDTGALPDTAGGAALVVAPDDAGAWAAAIDSLDEEIRADLSTRGRVHAARFTWDQTAAATVEVYRAVLGTT
jgi:glycosyltransferase involved in cell wall biosynthesis